MENKVKVSKMAESQVLDFANVLADALRDLEKNFGGKYEEEDRRAKQIEDVRQSLKAAIEATAQLYAYEVQSRAFVEAEQNK